MLRRRACDRRAAPTALIIISIHPVCLVSQPLGSVGLIELGDNAVVIQVPSRNLKLISL